MIPIARLQENADDIIARLKIKNYDAKDQITQALILNDQRKATQKQLDDLLANSNKISQEIAVLYKEGKGSEAEAKKSESSQIKDKTSVLNSELKDIESKIDEILLQIPNVPSKEVPSGTSEKDNVTVRQHGDIPKLHDKALPHWELCKKYDIIDFDLGVKITGTGFPMYKGKGARLERALIQYFLTKANEAGYTEYNVPLMVNEASALGTGQLPDKEGQMYQNNDGFYMIPTSEVPLTNIYRDTILTEAEMPKKMTAYSQCFRREAGSYGKDVRGLNRLHQFDKVEVVQIVHPDTSYNVLEEMTSYVESLIQSLGLPYRVLKLCGGDISFASALTYDLEVYSTAQDRWLEVSSVSNFEDFQANRLKARFKNAEGKSQLVHTLNGSAIALPRIVAAILENFQTENGIKMPEVLVPYLGFDIID